MIKKLVFIPLSCLLLLALKPSNDASSERILKDYWLLDKVSYMEPDFYDRITLFNDVTNLCFEQSLWRFSELNNTGTYSINDLYCAYGKRKISFDIAKSANKKEQYDVVLKTKKDNGETESFKIKITKLSKNTMQWNHTTWVDNEPHTLKMSFVKKQAL
ncbi:hypothetical protein KO494_01740 [Lacinutrix sp. C3R15]|uniref:hypothetical protein n=1 Tax=Flavobacteriaceae TaxID=49546 RepID=UPI001C0930E7|nr:MULTISPECIES: hypothetical protein [Flavobacteriaceae]MBU2938251.1 hypothetical protein [Lacinutrix sp. C3R15]MDO6621565.1 hypothetical protein [Oceanihabitans sp. 1_MG-2023]